MTIKYISVSDRVQANNELKLINDFVQSTAKTRYIIIRKVRLINNNGQLDVGCCLCGNFGDESSYSYGIMDDYIMCTNEFNEKEIKVCDKNLKYLKFFFRDYKGEKISYEDEYYYTLDLKLIY